MWYEREGGAFMMLYSQGKGTRGQGAAVCMQPHNLACPAEGKAEAPPAVDLLYKSNI